MYSIPCIDDIMFELKFAVISDDLNISIPLSDWRFYECMILIYWIVEKLLFWLFDCINYYIEQNPVL